MRVHEEESGQVLVIVALSIVALMLSVALAVDWGYGLTQRRVMQNAADAGALAGGRMLAGSVVASGGTTYFASSQQQVYCTAASFAESNIGSFGSRGGALPVTVEYGTVAEVDKPDTWSTSPITWTTSATTALRVPNCQLAGATIDSRTRFVRVTAGTQFRALFAGSDLKAGATARARLSGSGITRGPTWPMMRHYVPDDFKATSCTPDSGGACDPRSITPSLFWSPNGAGVAIGSFKGLVDFSKTSTYLAPATQLLTQADRRSAKKDVSVGGKCGLSRVWNPSGDPEPPQDTHCDLPNWSNYYFEGTIGLETSWPAVAALGSRSICPAPQFLQAPSCGNGNDRLGDWVEVSTCADCGQNIALPLKSAIDTYGTLTHFSSQGIPGPGNSRKICKSPSDPDAANSDCYGKALTIPIYLWDCADHLAGGSWVRTDPQSGSSDCANFTPSEPQNSKLDRVHVFTVAAFTFYYGLIDGSSQISGFWGGVLAGSGSCATAPSLTPTNTYASRLAAWRAICGLNGRADTAVLDD